MKSKYGNRDTVGTTYLEAQGNSTEGLLLGDIGTEMSKDLIDDINDTAESNPFEGRPFYINIVEQRDLQMKNAFKRRIFKTLYRPYPENNTLVFYVEPKPDRISYCWDLPHHSELPNILSNFMLYDAEYVRRIRDWLSNDLSNFGYVKVSMTSSQVEGYDEKVINSYKKCYIEYCDTIDMDKKAVETEKKLGFFWIPNRLYKDKLVGSSNPKVTLLGV